MKKTKMISLALVCALLLSLLPCGAGGAEETDISKGLLAYYSFEDDGENPGVIKDMSGNGNDAQVLNSSTGKISVKNGTADFPGCTRGDDNTCIPGAALRLPDGFNKGICDFTFSAWVKANSSYTYAQKSDYKSRIFDFGNIDGNDTYNSIYARYIVKDGLLTVQDRGGSADTRSIYRETTLSDKPFNDKWGLLTVSFEYDASSKSYRVSTYINGAKNSAASSQGGLFKRSLDDLGDLSGAANGLFIGRAVWAIKAEYRWENPDFCGSMDDIRIYSRALSASEVEYLYNSTAEDKLSSKVVFYRTGRVYTAVGREPELPTKVEAVYASGDTGKLAVEWENTESSLYAQPGDFTVRGIVSATGAEVEIAVTVRGAGESSLDEGLILCYNFANDGENPSVIRDVSGNGNDAQVYNTSYSQNGTTGQNALTIEDGTAKFPGYLQDGSFSAKGAALKLPCGAVEGVGDFTYSAWIKADMSYVYKSGLIRFFDFGRVRSDNTNSIFFRYVPSSGDARLQDRYVAASLNDEQSMIFGTLSDKPFNDRWALLTVTYKKDGVVYLPTVYIDGVKRDDFTSDTTVLTRSLGDLGPLSESTNGLWIGRTQWNTTTNPDFCGQMDEIRLYSRALGADEVTELYETTYPSDGIRGDAVIYIRSYDDEGNIISEERKFAYTGDTYSFEPEPIIVLNGRVYVISRGESVLTTENVGQNTQLSAVYRPASVVEPEKAVVKKSNWSEIQLPESVSVTADGETCLMRADWGTVSSEGFHNKGLYERQGTIAGTDVPIDAEIHVFTVCDGKMLGDVTLNIYLNGSNVSTMKQDVYYGDMYYVPEYFRAPFYGYVLEKVDGDISDFDEGLLADSIGQKVNLHFVPSNELSAMMDARVVARNEEETEHNIILSGKICNMQTSSRGAYFIEGAVNSNGELEYVKTTRYDLESLAREDVYIKEEYSEETKKKIYFIWADDMTPLTDKIEVSRLSPEPYLEDDIGWLLPTYDSAVRALRKANDYWQRNVAAASMSSSWDNAAYHTGNIEAYKLLGDEKYLDYSADWANGQKWRSWGDEFFGDNQTCFQTYIDLYNFGVEGANTDRVLDVMGRQTATSSDSYWYWADALYMVMPVMTKLYNLTGEEIYLDKLYEWFRYAKELMYDGEGGIPTNSGGYTTSAKLRSGANYADADDYKNLFYRDANYVYPLNPNSGHTTEKNFWSRGNGWVFAALAKVLSDVPEDWKHYGEFYKTYVEMAEAIKASQVKDDDYGYGFWTQSLLQNYPKGGNSNNKGCETSGTAFFTYGLFWGINSGILDEDEYLETAARGWAYLENAALLDDGSVGFVQPIGSNAMSSAAPRTSTANFGTGAFLLAACEAARWAEVR